MSKHAKRKVQNVKKQDIPEKVQNIREQDVSEEMLNAETAFSNENYSLAFDYFKKGLGKKSDDTHILSRLGAVCIMLNKYDEAFEYFQRAVILAPENGDYIFYLGNAYFFKDDYVKALNMYAEAEIKGISDKVKPHLYYYMALICSANNNFEAALVNFEKYEKADKDKKVAFSIDVLSEKIKIYLALKKYDKAENCAVQWIMLAPEDIRGYMIRFNILMIKHDYKKATEVIEEVKKYVVIDETMRLNLRIEEVTLLTAQADENAKESKIYLEKALNLINELIEKAPEDKKEEMKLILAETNMKMGNYSEAINVAEILFKDLNENIMVQPAESVYNTVSESDEDYEGLSEEEQDYLMEHYVQNIEDEDELNNVFTQIETDVEYNTDSNNADNKNREKKFDIDYYDRLCFVLLSCYAVTENYAKSYELGKILKNSNNTYYSYFGHYTEAFSAKKLMRKSQEFTKDMVDKKYTENIAFYRKKMLEGKSVNFAVMFRARMYAEMGKLAKAKEMADLLSPAERESVMAYIEECRKTYDN